MNKSKLKPSIFLGIFCILFGTVFALVAGLFPTAKDILDNGGEETTAIILDIDTLSDTQTTTVQIDDSDSLYDGEIIKVGQYSSSLHEGQLVTAYYDGETLLLDALAFMPPLFTLIGNVIRIFGVIVLAVGIIRIVLFASVVGAGLAAGSSRKKARRQKQSSNTFNGNLPSGTNPYSGQIYPQNQQYGQYGNPYPQQYNQNQQPNQYQVQQQNQQYQQPQNHYQ